MFVVDLFWTLTPTVIFIFSFQSQESTDTESSVTSSVRVPRRQDLPQPAERFTTLRAVNQPLQGLTTETPDSNVQLENTHCPDLETQVREIAAREGVSLRRTNLQALTSITIATRRRSTSTTPSTSPAPSPGPAIEPLHLTELSTGAAEHPKVNRQLSVTQDDKDNRVRDQSEEPSPPLQDSEREYMNVKVDSELSIRDSTLSVSHGAERATGSTTTESPIRTDHISHVHLTLSPKAADQSVAPAVHPGHAAGVTALPRKEIVSLRPASISPSTPDERVGLSSPPEWVNTREGEKKPGHERIDTSSLCKTFVPHARFTSTSTKSSTSPHRADDPRYLNTQSPGGLVIKIS